MFDASHDESTLVRYHAQTGHLQAALVVPEWQRQLGTPPVSSRVVGGHRSEDLVSVLQSVADHAEPPGELDARRAGRKPVRPLASQKLRLTSDNKS